MQREVETVALGRGGGGGGGQRPKTGAWRAAQQTAPQHCNRRFGPPCHLPVLLAICSLSLLPLSLSPSLVFYVSSVCTGLSTPPPLSSHLPSRFKCHLHVLPLTNLKVKDVINILVAVSCASGPWHDCSWRPKSEE